jgi:hypothetical protein
MDASFVDEYTRRGLRWLALNNSGFTAQEIANAEALSLRTIRYGIRRAKDWIEASDSTGVHLTMTGVQGHTCRHPRRIYKHSVYYCLDCGWSNHPDDRRLWWEKKRTVDEGKEIAKELQPRGAATFRPHTRKKLRK